MRSGRTSILKYLESSTLTRARFRLTGLSLLIPCLHSHNSMTSKSSARLCWNWTSDTDEGFGLSLQSWNDMLENASTATTGALDSGSTMGGVFCITLWQRKAIDQRHQDDV